MSESGIAIDFEGERLSCRPGESLAAALTAHGIRDFRRTRTGGGRGIFCGIGVCQDCLVEINGVPSLRACMTSVDRPMRVRRQQAARALPADDASLPPVTIDDIPVERPELLVIGAGPGGLSTAIAARHAGAQVVLVDERKRPGGQYFKPVAVTGADIAPPDAQHREGLALVRAAEAAGVDLRSGVTIWGAFARDELAATTSTGATIRFAPKALIVATGAYERGWPVPGWHLPGVMTTGAAQTLWRTARRLPGRRVLIAGNGPLNLQLAAELSDGGAEVVGVAEAARPGLADAGALAAMLRADPSLVADGIRYHWRRGRGRVPLLSGMVVAAVAQDGAGLAVTLEPASGDGARRVIAADTLCLGYGFEPSNDILRALGCRHDPAPDGAGLITVRDAEGRTSVPGVYALGDCTGMGGARVALADGTLTGLAAAADLGHPIGPALAPMRRSAAAAAARHRRFQKALWRLFRAPTRPLSQIPNDTMLCRCEEISFGDARAALADGHLQAGAIKRATRIGMGPCQGRYCRPLLEALVSDVTGRSPDAYSGFAPRPPIKPVAIRDLAARDPSAR